MMIQNINLYFCNNNKKLLFFLIIFICFGCGKKRNTLANIIEADTGSSVYDKYKKEVSHNKVDEEVLEKLNESEEKVKGLFEKQNISDKDIVSFEETITKFVQVGYFEKVNEMLADLNKAIPQNKLKANNTALKLIDTTFTPGQLFELAKVSEQNVFPSDLIYIKLAKVMYHMQEYDSAYKFASDFLLNFPSHKLSDSARKLITLLNNRQKIDIKAIGVILPLSGKYINYGRQLLGSLQLAVENVINPSKNKDLISLDGELKVALDKKSGLAKPIVLNYQNLNVIILDSGGNADITRLQVNKLIMHYHVIAILGPILTSTSLAAALEAENLQVPIISLSKMENLPQVGHYVFRNSLTAENQVHTLVDFTFNTLKIEKYAVVYPEHPYGIQLMKAFYSEVNRVGGKVVTLESYAQDQTTFDKQAMRLTGRYYKEARDDYKKSREDCYKENNSFKKKKCLEKIAKKLPAEFDFEAVFIPDYYKTVSLLVPALAAQNIELTSCLKQYRKVKRKYDGEMVQGVCLLGTNGWNFPQIVEWTGRYIKGAVFVDGFSTANENPIVSKFVHSFEALFQRPPTILSAKAFDSMTLLSKIVKSNLVKNREEFREKLLLGEKMIGVTGDLRFSENGEVISDNLLLTVHKKSIVPVESVLKPKNLEVTDSKNK